MLVTLILLPVSLLVGLTLKAAVGAGLRTGAERITEMRHGKY